MAYLVTARKYRPQVFEELIGQEHIASTLQNAILKKRVGHAYLFSGPRGIGKTSAARIFAKALNCENGPTPTPCNSCNFCQEITQGNSLDLVEIDGASNRRIDEIRKLRENVRFVPSSSRFKIYIIDEVHMLTPEAFNALLKTLEEPPEHIIFIFATTEVNKVPQTIRSRCQQFVFKRIPIPLIVDMLKKILKDISMEAEEKALFWIAKSASGSMRDAESILDQMISFCETKITEKDVFYVLGMPHYEVYHQLAGYIADSNFDECLTLLDRLINDGVEVQNLISGLIEYFRDLYILSSGDRLEELINLPREDVEAMKSLLKIFKKRDINNILILLSKSYMDIRNSELSRELFEITLLKCLHYREIINPSSLLRRLEELKREIVKEKHPEQGDSSEVVKESFSSPKKLDEESPSIFNNLEEVEKKSSSQQNQVSINQIGQAEDNDKEDSGKLRETIISYFSRKRRAVAEFLSRAKSYSLDNNIFTILYEKKERYSFDHVSDEKTRRYIEKEIKELTARDVKVRIVIKNDNHLEENEAIPPGVEKVLEIFKGEIVQKDNGGN